MPTSLSSTAVRDRRPWHGAAFIVEALVLLAFMVAALAVVMPLMISAHERGVEAQQLSCAIILASNDAETFAAYPESSDVENTYAFVDGELVDIDTLSDKASAITYQVVRTVQSQTSTAGVYHTAHISVFLKGKELYNVSTSRYTSNVEVRP